MQHTGKSKSIRVPNNTHPSHLTYGSCEEDDMFYSAHGTPASISHSFGNTLSNFAGSYSRTSVLYVADSLPVPSPQRLVEHQEELPINKTE
jgi:hypothetical protein